MLLTIDALRRLDPPPPSGTAVEIDGWLMSFGPEAPPNYYALVDHEACCIACLPHDAGRRIEILAAGPMPAGGGPVRIGGHLHVLDDVDEAGWRYQLREAWLVQDRRRPGSLLGRRAAMAGPLLCVALTPAGVAAQTPTAAQARAVLADTPTVDIHSHAGAIIGVRRVREKAAFAPVAGPMRDGGMAVLCLATVADSPVIQVQDNRIRPVRSPRPGELYDFSQLSFQRIHDLVREQGLRLVTTAADLAQARGSRPAILVASEGADFLEGRAERLSEAHEKWKLRHLQLTHYRPNELGDIQTEPEVHGGLTDFGADIVRLCNRLGIVVDVAHGTLALVKRAAAITTKPLVISHTSLVNRPGPQSRQISPEHARIIAGTGGVIGIWPPTGIFPDITALAAGMARMVDAIGIDHVGLGSDMEGLVGGSAFLGYQSLPDLAAALMARGLNAGEVRKLLGENYRRVFTRTAG